MKIEGKVKDVQLNSHIVKVITPVEPVSYEEGIKRINKILQSLG